MKLIYFFLFFVYFNNIQSQNVFITYLNDSSLMNCTRVLETNDNGYLLTCVENIGANFIPNLKTRLIKLDYQGNILWDKLYNETSSSETFSKVVNAFDDGYIIASETFSFQLQDEDTIEDILIRKININGDLEWYKVYASRLFSDIITTSDSSYLLLSQVHEQYGYISSDIHIHKINLKGNIKWKKRYGIKKDNYPYVWESTHNLYEFGGNYYASGLVSKLDSSIYSSGFIYKIDQKGNEIWNLNNKFNDEFSNKDINSVFKLNNKFYFNSYLEDELFIIDDENGLTKKTNKYVKLRNSLGNLNRNYSINCNVLTTINIKDSFIVFKKYKNIEMPFYTKKIKNDFLTFTNVPNKERFIIDMQVCKDGGFVLLTTTNSKGYLIEKLDCMGNNKYWNLECNSKIKEKKIIIYPNPTNNILNIETKFKIKNVEVLNVLGQTISYKNYCNCNTQAINIINLPNGNYYLKVLGNNKSINGKFIKK